MRTKVKTCKVLSAVPRAQYVLHKPMLSLAKLFVFHWNTRYCMVLMQYIEKGRLFCDGRWCQGRLRGKEASPRLASFTPGAKRQKVYVHDYSVLKAQRIRFSVEEIPFLKRHKLNAYWNFEVEYRVFPAVMHFQTGSSILVPGTGDIKMSPPSTNGVVEEGSKSEEYYPMSSVPWVGDAQSWET